MNFQAPTDTELLEFLLREARITCQGLYGWVIPESEPLPDRTTAKQAVADAWLEWRIRQDDAYDAARRPTTTTPQPTQETPRNHS